jgi:hypothetical protein
VPQAEVIDQQPTDQGIDVLTIEGVAVRFGGAASSW